MSVRESPPTPASRSRTVMACMAESLFRRLLAAEAGSAEPAWSECRQATLFRQGERTQPFRLSRVSPGLPVWAALGVSRVTAQLVQRVLLWPAWSREARRAKELAGQGHLLRLWMPGPGQALGLWRARDAGQMHAIVRSLPLDPWLTTEITPLTPHPSDPVLTGSPDTDLGAQAPADMS